MELAVAQALEHAELGTMMKSISDADAVTYHGQNVQVYLQRNPMTRQAISTSPGDVQDALCSPSTLLPADTQTRLFRDSKLV